MLNYKCILLDHDDTIVESTQEIHYPSFLETLRTFRCAIIQVSWDCAINTGSIRKK
jgi:predicted HAD superfamily phosphohydrolase YqeG